MSAGKNPFLRYSIIDHCLSSRSKRYWPPDDLIEKFAEYDLQVELRTLKYDLQNMRENSQIGYHAPIGYCRTNKGYYYTQDGYSIDGERLSHHDLIALTFVVNLVEKVEGGELLQRAKGTISKLNKPHKSLKTTVALERNIFAAQPRPYYKGVHYLSMLAEAIFQAQPLRIAYRKFNDDAATDHVFHPYQLKPYQDRWYVRGYSEKHGDVIILALDRIEGLKHEPTPYRNDTAMHDKEYFHHTIGISKGNGPVEEIKLAFTPEQAHYIRTLHLHHTQQIIKDDAEGMIIALQLIQNYELCQLIMSFMPNVTVLQPLDLRDKVVTMLQKGLERNTHSST